MVTVFMIEAGRRGVEALWLARISPVRRSWTRTAVLAGEMLFEFKNRSTGDAAWRREAVRMISDRSIRRVMSVSFFFSWDSCVSLIHMQNY